MIYQPQSIKRLETKEKMKKKLLGELGFTTMQSAVISCLINRYQIKPNDQNGTNRTSCQVYSAYKHHISIMTINFTCAM